MPRMDTLGRGLLFFFFFIKRRLLFGSVFFLSDSRVFDSGPSVTVFQHGYQKKTPPKKQGRTAGRILVTASEILEFATRLLMKQREAEEEEKQEEEEGGGSASRHNWIL